METRLDIRLGHWCNACPPHPLECHGTGSTGEIIFYAFLWKLILTGPCGYTSYSQATTHTVCLWLLMSERGCSSYLNPGVSDSSSAVSLTWGVDGSWSSALCSIANYARLDHRVIFSSFRLTQKCREKLKWNIYLSLFLTIPAELLTLSAAVQPCRDSFLLSFSGVCPLTESYAPRSVLLRFIRVSHTVLVSTPCYLILHL